MLNRTVFILSSFTFIVTLFYLPGLMLYPFFKEYFQLYYQYQGTPYVAFMVFFTTYLALFFSLYSFADKLPYIKGPKIPTACVRRWIVVIVVLYLVMCATFYLNYDAGFRHSSRLANTGLLIKGLFFFQPLIDLYVLFCIVHVLNGHTIGGLNKKLLMLVLASELLSLNSSLQIIAIFFLLILLMKPDMYRRSLIRLNAYYVVAIMAALPCLFAGVIVMGLGNKLGFEYIFTERGWEYLGNNMGFIVARVSSSLFSVATVFDCCLFDANTSLLVVDGFSATFMNRLALLWPDIGFDNSLINTVSRTNFLMVFQGYIDRAGASPGPLASMFYSPVYPFGIILVPILHVVIARAISYHLEKRLRYNVISMVAIPFFILPFFEAPLNIFYIIDPVFIGLICLFGFRLIRLKEVLAN